ncbi:MAG TPA: hypothetical protein VLT62_11550 [Candidatus Methylomirabilis sp.]|nr:hypothetical protein [Candidatus Methylomirabilis sp.]
MNTKQYAIETLKITSLALVLVGLLFAVPAWAQVSQTEGATEIDVGAEQESLDASAPQDTPDRSVGGSPERTRAKDARIRRKAQQQARRQESVRRIRSLREEAAKYKAVPAAASLPAAALTGINVLFKMDPRITRGLYMGDRWISPPTFSGVQEGNFTAEARVQGRDANGQPVKISPEWIPTDPEMVTVSPRHGDAVQITVRRAGQSSLKVVAQGVSKELVIKASYPDNMRIQAEISQKQ